MHKTHLKALFSKFCLLEIIVRPFFSWVLSLKCVTLLAFKLEHFKMAYISAKTFSIPLPLIRAGVIMKNSAIVGMNVVYSTDVVYVCHDVCNGRLLV